MSALIFIFWGEFVGKFSKKKNNVSVHVDKDLGIFIFILLVPFFTTNL